jgi:hypothetical protein
VLPGHGGFVAPGVPSSTSARAVTGAGHQFAALSLSLALRCNGSRFQLAPSGRFADHATVSIVTPPHTSASWSLSFERPIALP